MGKLIAENRKARHDYFIEDRYEAALCCREQKLNR